MNKEKILGFIKNKIMRKEYLNKIIKIGNIVLVSFIFLSGIALWIQVGGELLLKDKDLLGKPCYENGDIATIEIRGEIVPYFLYDSDGNKPDDSKGYDAVSSEEVVACINDIKYDDDMEGVIVEIDSRGGSPFASEEIMKAINGLNKPTVAVIRESATSGAYLIASATDRIFASDFSDIGGIGVTMSYLDYSQKNEEDGITYQQISSGKFKDAGDPDKPLTQEEYDLLIRDTELMHAMFTANVAANRGLDIEKVIKLADGSSMLGEMAKENGLIDETGDTNSATVWLKSKIK